MPLFTSIATSFKQFFYEPQGTAAPIETKAITGVDSIGRTNPIYINSSPFNFSLRNDDPNAVFYTIRNAIQLASRKAEWSVYRLEKDETAAKIPNHALAEVLYRPNPKQNWTSFVEDFIGQYLSTGNAFIYAMRNENGLNRGKIKELRLMPSNTEVEGQGGWLGRVTGYKVPNDRGGYDTFAPEDVLHLKKFSLDGGLYGLSPISAMVLPLRGIDQALSQKVRLLAQGGPATVFFVNDAPSGDQNTVREPLTIEQITALNNKIKAGQTTFMNDRIASTTIGLSPVDLEILESITADSGMVADALNYPAMLLSNSKSTTYNNVESAHKALYENCVLPLLNELRDGLNMQFGAYYSDKAYIDYSVAKIGVLKPNVSELIKSVQSADFMTVNEKRKEIGLGVVDGGDGFLVSMATQYRATIDAEESDVAA